MAASATMQSVLVSPVSSLSSRTRFSNGVSSVSVFHLQRNVNMKVKCMAEDGKKEEVSPGATPASIPTPTPTPVPPPSKKVQAKTGFFDVLAFGGPGPEIINGRLAMIGFVGALAAELSTGQDVITQIANGGVLWFLGTSVLLSLASLIPLFKGVSAQSKSDGIMTSDAELLNGRLAMLGLVALAATEYVKGSALV